MADARVLVRIADLPQVKTALDDATAKVTHFAADRDALGEAGATFCRANAAWNAVANTEHADREPALSAYWHALDHLIFTLRRLGYLPADEDAGGSGA